jgi:flagellar biosynthesis anti-sigma factor FlgM
MATLQRGNQQRRGIEIIIQTIETGAEMEINKVSGYAGQKPKVQELETKADVEKRSEEAKEAGGQGAADRVQLSRDYQELSKVKRVTMELPEIRGERVDQLRNLIANNEYQINPTKLADKILEETI